MADPDRAVRAGHPRERLPGHAPAQRQRTSRACGAKSDAMSTYHLAQVNIGRFRAPLEDPIMEGFRNALEPINALADRSPGFVWRLQTEDGNATAIRPYGNDNLIAINMSVWESLQALQ